MNKNLTSDEILHSLNTQEVVIFTDGSCSPNPGPGGCGIVVYPPHNQQMQVLEYPILGITTNISCEIIAISKALEFVRNNYNRKEQRIIYHFK
jgi:ribonuclease HI